MIRIGFILCWLACPVTADVLVATRTIPARAIIGADDLAVRDMDMMGGIIDPNRIIGQEARVALFAGRPIRSADIGPPSVVERNQIVSLVYSHGGIVISTDGRALDRAGPGDFIRVMNITSRTTVTAQIDANGIAFVTQ